MPNLDDPQTYVDLDPSGMAGRLSDVPRQCLQGWRQATSLELPGLSGLFDHVVIAGMGGSAIAGDLVADLASLQGRLPVTVVREFEIPFSLNPQTLMIACSYSGNTQETLAMFRHGLDMGATAVAATAGGTLAREASERDVPTLFVDVEGEPRNAAVYNFTLLLGLLSRLGLLNTDGSDVEATAGALTMLVAALPPDVPARDNPAKQLAMELVDRLPLVCAGGIFRGVARRWKSQFNENAKVWAICETFPELLHNSVEAIGRGLEGGQAPMTLLLRPHGIDGPAMERYLALEKLLISKEVAHRVIPGCGDTPLEQLLDMLVLGDYVSYYLAMLRGVNPSPTPTLDSLKRRPTGD